MLDRFVPWPPLAAELPPQSIEALQAIALVVALSVVVGWIGYVFYRRSVHGQAGGDAPQDVFTLSDLRRLRREGHMSEEEFELAKARLLAAYQTPAEPAADDDEREVVDLGHIGGDDEPAPPPDDARPASPAGADDADDAAASSENAAADGEGTADAESEPPGPAGDGGAGEEEGPR